MNLLENEREIFHRGTDVSMSVYILLGNITWGIRCYAYGSAKEKKEEKIQRSR